jgi:hypothetical protein
MPRFEENEILMEEFYNFEMIASDDFNFADLALNKKDDEEDDDADDDETLEDEEVEENPFDKEPSENDIIDDDIPLFDAEDELLDDDDDFPYN